MPVTGRGPVAWDEGYAMNTSQIVAGRHIAAIAATLPPEVVEAAQERGRAREREATVAELLVELGNAQEE